MANLSGAITNTDWVDNEDHQLVGDVVLTLDADLTYTGTLTDDGNGPYSITLSSDSATDSRTFDLTGATLSTANISQWVLNARTLTIIDEDSKLGVVPTAVDR